MTNRFFNTAGPCRPSDHYMLPTANRLPEIKGLIEEKGYFVLHAPRQTGKTTLLLELAKELTGSGRYSAAMLSAEVGSAFNQQPDIAEGAILASWQQAAKWQLPPELHPPSNWGEGNIGQRIELALSNWASASPRPLVLFLDEIDSLQDQTLFSMLRQLRAGYFRRPAGFPWSLALVGLRDVRDYKVTSGESGRSGTASPFNIKTESLTLSNFTAQEVSDLYEQHTAETGQPFSPAAKALAYQLTQGQPWLVNALAYTITRRILPNSTEAIGESHIQQAKEMLIARQDTHLDSLAERLREPRVRRIIEPIMAGDALGDVPADDIRFVLDLGLCRLDPKGGLTIANPIYREVLPTVLAGTPIASLPRLTPTWLDRDGNLEPPKLLEAFLKFWRQHGQPLLGSAPYHEIAPHLVLMAFLHRVVNGGGTLEREYAIGSQRMDLCLRYRAVTLAIELKVWHEGRKDPLPDGLSQLDEYLAGLGLESGWLVIFDRRANQPPISERTTTELALSPAGHPITLIRA